MIYCIWYPSGGFGHFFNSMIGLHGDNFARPHGDLVLGADGNSHGHQLLLPKYKYGRPFCLPYIDPALHYTILIDNGINDETLDWRADIPGSKILKICYDDWSWPIVAHTHIIKAMRSDFNRELSIDLSLWSEKSDWAQREKFFLYLRDHPLRNCWRPTAGIDIVPISCLYHYYTMRDRLADLGISLRGGEDDYQRWYLSNQKYILPVIAAQQVIQNIQDVDQPLDHIDDLWTQAVIYYFLYLHHGIEVPHNDYADFFRSTKDIKRLLAR